MVIKYLWTSICMLGSLLICRTSRFRLEFRLWNQGKMLIRLSWSCIRRSVMICWVILIRLLERINTMKTCWSSKKSKEYFNWSTLSILRSMDLKFTTPTKNATPKDLSNIKRRFINGKLKKTSLSKRVGRWRFFSLSSKLILKHTEMILLIKKLQNYV